MFVFGAFDSVFESQLLKKNALFLSKYRHVPRAGPLSIKYRISTFIPIRMCTGNGYI